MSHTHFTDPSLFFTPADVLCPHILWQTAQMLFPDESDMRFGCKAKRM